MMWIRYRHIKGHYSDSPAKVQLLNVVSFLAGFLSVFGLLLVSSFQVSIHHRVSRCTLEVYRDNYGTETPIYANTLKYPKNLRTYTYYTVRLSGLSVLNAHMTKSVMLICHCNVMHAWSM